jgi:hypothetical protein
MVIEFYNSEDIVLADVSLKRASQVIVIRASVDEEQLFLAVEIAMEHGYKIISTYNGGGTWNFPRVVLERA